MREPFPTAVPQSDCRCSDVDMLTQYGMGCTEMIGTYSARVTWYPGNRGWGDGTMDQSLPSLVVCARLVAYVFDSLGGSMFPKPNGAIRVTLLSATE